MEAYDKFRLREVDGVISKDLKPIKVSGKAKILSDDYVKLENENKFKSGFFYVKAEKEKE